MRGELSVCMQGKLSLHSEWLSDRRESELTSCMQFFKHSNPCVGCRDVVVVIIHLDYNLIGS